MTLFSEGFWELCEYIGLSMICLFIFTCCWGLLSWLKKVLMKQTKIKCICRHEYEVEFITNYNSSKRREYDLKCRKCGKTKRIRIYDKAGDSDV